MRSYSTSEVARRIGLHPASLARYIAIKKVPAPRMVTTGRTKTHIWTGEEIKELRKLLPKIANGRKTRYQKKKRKTQKPQPTAAAPHKKKK